MKILKREYDDLARDSEKVRIITEAVAAHEDIPYSLMRIICGLQVKKVPTPEPGEIGILIEDVEEPEQQEEVTEPNTPDAPQETDPVRGRRKIDRGKVMALHNAGWSNVKIAEEMGCSAWSVGTIIKEEKQNAISGL